MHVDSECVKAVQVTQLDRDTVLIALESRFTIFYLQIKYLSCPNCILYFMISAMFLTIETVKIVNLQGVPSMDFASEMEFGFPVETLGEKA